jgi:hypothetical protein
MTGPVGAVHHRAAGDHFPVADAGYLAFRRQWWHLAAFAGAVLLLEILIGPLKAVYGRVRPPGSLVATNGASFPSGHPIAASVTVLAAVIALVPPGRRRVAWGAAGAAFAVVMAASRAYLGRSRAPAAWAASWPGSWPRAGSGAGRSAQARRPGAAAAGREHGRERPGRRPVGDASRRACCRAVVRAGDRSVGQERGRHRLGQEVGIGAQCPAAVEHEQFVNLDRVVRPQDVTCLVHRDPLAQQPFGA